MQMRLELVPLPSTDVDRSTVFYTDRWDSPSITTCSRATECGWSS